MDRQQIYAQSLHLSKHVGVQVDRDLVDEVLHLMAGEEPANFAEAAPHEQWRCTMNGELQAIHDNDTWTLVDPPRGERGIGLKWVFKLKKDAVSAVVKHKVRLVAKGYV